MSANIEFEKMAKPSPEELLVFYRRQAHQSTQDIEKLKRMVMNTNCIVTARQNGELIGLARGISDGVWGSLLECKLDPSCQGPACVTRTDGRIEHDAEGIARQMALLVLEALSEGGAERIDVLAYPTEEDFCEELGFRRSKGLVAMELDVKTSPALHAPATAGAST